MLSTFLLLSPSFIVRQVHKSVSPIAHVFVVFYCKIRLVLMCGILAELVTYVTWSDKMGLMARQIMTIVSKFEIL